MSIEEVIAGADSLVIVRSLYDKSDLVSLLHVGDRRCGNSGMFSSPAASRGNVISVAGLLTTFSHAEHATNCGANVTFP